MAVNVIINGETQTLDRTAGQSYFDIFTNRQNGPGVPLPPTGMKADRLSPRRFQPTTSQNLKLTPRSEDPRLAPFPYLRNLAANCDIADICIATRIKEIQGYTFRIIAKKRGDQKKLQKDCDAIKDWFDLMDGVNDFADNIGQILYDLLSIDAHGLYKERDYGGNLCHLIPTDGATWKPIMDSQMKVVVYQQILFGMVVGEFLPNDELVYAKIRTFSYTPYGRSPLESVLQRIKTLLRKQDWDFSHYDSSSIPRMFMGSPETWSDERIQTFFEDLNTMLSGNDDMLQQIIGIPGDVTKMIREVKPHEKYDPALDDFMNRMICAAFQVPPAELGMTSQLHQTGSKHQAGVNKSAGQIPLILKLKRLFDPIIQNEHGYYPLECQFVDDEGLDPLEFLQRAQGMKVYADMGAAGAKEIRANELAEYDDNDGTEALPATVHEVAPTPDAPLLATPKPEKKTSSVDEIALKAAMRGQNS